MKFMQKAISGLSLTIPYHTYQKECIVLSHHGENNISENSASIGILRVTDHPRLSLAQERHESSIVSANGEFLLTLPPSCRQNTRSSESIFTYD